MDGRYYYVKGDRMRHTFTATVLWLLVTFLVLTMGISIALAEEYRPIKEECWNNLEE